MNEIHYHCTCTSAISLRQCELSCAWMLCLLASLGSRPEPFSTLGYLGVFIPAREAQNAS